MEFHFRIIETQQGSIVVQANDYEEALREAHDVYNAGAIKWDEVEMSVSLDRSYD